MCKQESQEGHQGLCKYVCSTEEGSWRLPRVYFTLYKDYNPLRTEMGKLFAKSTLSSIKSEPGTIQIELFETVILTQSWYLTQETSLTVSFTSPFQKKHTEVRLALATSRAGRSHVQCSAGHFPEYHRKLRISTFSEILIINIIHELVVPLKIWNVTKP